MQSILVKDYMDPNTHAIQVTSNIRDAVESMLRNKVIGAPVVDSDHKLVGYVSEQDCMKEMLNNTFYCEEPPNITKVMSKAVLSATPDTSILEIAEKMLDRLPKNYPVIRDGKLIGIINRSHVLRALIENDADCYIHR
ncbi:CBS domain-containing protein [Aestuariicella sp. G3-2]|uniref:CBS domain-containing protein n=1 Tax=Pseudomaricurvus albidus TaxID=2842452 RepID=UPI001C0B4EFB|nr:CBS domain-containing protein [Aestuariicella albida]MBU3069865.1 CBS domain-containing protein [Aestuariicella albida]